LALDSRRSAWQAGRFSRGRCGCESRGKNAGIAPIHDVSQLSQSGAKIAPPRKAEELDQRKDDKR